MVQGGESLLKQVRLYWLRSLYLCIEEYMYIFTQLYVYNNYGKKAKTVKENKEGNIGGFGGRKKGK